MAGADLSAVPWHSITGGRLGTAAAKGPSARLAGEARGRASWARAPVSPASMMAWTTARDRPWRSKCSSS